VAISTENTWTPDLVTISSVWVSIARAPGALSRTSQTKATAEPNILKPKPAALRIEPTLKSRLPHVRDRQTQRRGHLATNNSKRGRLCTIQFNHGSTAAIRGLGGSHGNVNRDRRRA
jgi:hypothetical protein